MLELLESKRRRLRLQRQEALPGRVGPGTRWHPGTEHDRSGGFLLYLEPTFLQTMSPGDPYRTAAGSHQVSVQNSLPVAPAAAAAAAWSGYEFDHCQGRLNERVV